MTKETQKFKEEVREVRDRIGRNLVYLREIRGMSQAILAKEMGIPQSHVSDAETGKRGGTICFLYHFSQYYRVPLGLLIDYELRENPDVLLRFFLKERSGLEGKLIDNTGKKAN